ncbi:MAG: hypothetical protein JXX14_11860 [Deltaproteobacteria bacterium]|nr:hypothetical protein [Deltaproteobacteria bacterium]
MTLFFCIASLGIAFGGVYSQLQLWLFAQDAQETDAKVIEKQKDRVIRTSAGTIRFRYAYSLKVLVSVQNDKTALNTPPPGVEPAKAASATERFIDTLKTLNNQNGMADFVMADVEVSMNVFDSVKKDDHIKVLYNKADPHIVMYSSGVAVSWVGLSLAIALLIPAFWAYRQFRRKRAPQ